MRYLDVESVVCDSWSPPVHGWGSMFHGWGPHPFYQRVAYKAPSGAGTIIHSEKVTAVLGLAEF